MALSDESITEFIRIWREEFGTEITRDFSATRFQQLVDLYVAFCEKLSRET